MKPRMIQVSVALGSCLILAGVQFDATLAAALDATPDAAGMCFDYPRAPSKADAGAHRSVPDQPLMSFQTGVDAGYLFQPEHDPSDWSGSLKKFAVAQDSAGQFQIGALLWDAGALLTSMPAAQRNIHTLRPNLDPAGLQSPATVPFTWARLAPQQRAALDLAPGSGLSDALGQRRLDFLRGDRSLEIGQPGGIFRRRTSVLGDAIHGAPLLVGAPSPGIPGAQYAAFFARHATRPAAVYLGANDGMLHAFDAASGRELFAYVPNLLMPWLNELTSAHHGHRPYVDGALNAAEALLDGQWKTVLVAGLGGGAAGVFALDVSAPDRFDQGGAALWEFGSADDAAIGHVVEAPLIAKFRIAAQPGGPGYRHFAVLAGGTDRAGQGGGALFLLALDKPASARWRLGVNYYKLTPPPATGAGNSAALAPPALALDVDGAVRYAYAGDMQGNLWRFDFSGKAPLSTAAHAQLLFVARDAGGVRQPITQAANVVFAPEGGYLVLFGTGKLRQASDNDPAQFKPQSFYAIHDAANPVATVATAVQGRAALAERTPGVEAAGPGEARQGWYLDFSHAASTGERSISGALLAGGKVIFNTVLPGSAPCTVTGVRTYAIDALTGLVDDIGDLARSGAVTGHGAVDPAPLHGVPVLLATARSVGPREATGRALVRQRYTVLNLGNGTGAGATGIGATEAVSVLSHPAPARRIDWREIANWPELHQAAQK